MDNQPRHTRAPGTGPRRAGSSGVSAKASLVFPALAWIAVFVVLPFFALGVLAFLTRTPDGQVEFTFTLEHVKRAIGYTDAGFVADNLRILMRTVVAAAVTSVTSVALGYPMALWFATRPLRWRFTLLALVTIPLCTNLVVRSYAWMLLFGPDALATRLARALHAIGPEQSLYPSIFAVYVGMISTALPFAILPLYTSAERIDWSLVDAARDLYGSGLRVFRHAVLAQTTPGLAVAFVLTFIPSLGMFVIPDLLGGAKYWLFGNLVQQQFGASRNWPYGAALSLALIVLTVPAIVLVLSRSGSRSEARCASAGLEGKELAR